MSFEPKSEYRALMNRLGALRASNFEGSAPHFIASSEAVDSTGPKVNQKVQEARLALAEVAIAMGMASKKSLEGELAFKPGVSMEIRGIDVGILSQLDGFDRLSSDEDPEKIEQLTTGVVGVLDWFDALDDGVPKRLIQQLTEAGHTPVGEEGRSMVTHRLLRKIEDVYEFSISEWKTSTLRDRVKAQSSTTRYYFKRNGDDGISRIVLAKANDYDHLSSPLFTAESTLQPAHVSRLLRELSHFKEQYSTQDTEELA